MRALVTGSDGFIGRHLVRRLIADGHQVVPYDICRGQDVRDTEALTYDMDGCEAVFHLAAINSGTRAFYDRPLDVLSVGAEGALSLIRAAQAASVPDLVVASSAEVYGEPLTVPTPETEPLKISDPSNPRFSYAVSKALSEVASLNASGFRKVRVFRPHNVYGPGQGRGHVIPDFIAMDEDRRCGSRIQGDGLETRAFCHVFDIVDGVMIMYERGETGVYHIGNDQETTIGDLARMIFTQPIYTGPPMRGSPRRRCPDISKMRALGYEPKVSLRQGVRGLIGEARWGGRV